MPTRIHTTRRLRALRMAGIALLLALAAVAAAQGNSARAMGPNAIRPGFNTSTLARNDDGSTGPVSIGFPINFYTFTTSQLYLNNNGNLTFTGPLGTYTPFNLASNHTRIIAPFFADVDTRSYGSPVTYGAGTVDGHAAWGATWSGVACYQTSAGGYNYFQVILIDRSDVGVADFDIEFNYDQIVWDSGQASGGNGNCLNGSAARAGFSDGGANAYELPGSAVDNAFRDVSATGLVHHSQGTSQLGRYVFAVRAGAPVQIATNLAVAPASGTYGGTTTLAATLTAEGAPLAGASVAFTLHGTAVGAAQTDANGVATLGDVSLSGIDAGTYPADVAAAFAGDGADLPSNGSNTLTIARAASTTTVTVPVGAVYDGTAKVATAQTTGIGGAVIASPAVSYTPGPGAPVNAGSYTASASFAGDTNYLPSSDSQPFTIAQATPTITWPAPAAIVYGTALGSTQLDATANTAGTFVYTPPAGTVLGVGSGQTLSVAFTPTDTVNYTTASATTTIDVQYASGGTCAGAAGHAVLQPVDADGTSVFKQGSTVPIKFRVCDANGVSIGTAGVVTDFRLVQVTTGTANTEVNEPVDSTTPDTTFRWDATAQQWIFNLNTKGLAAGSTYTYRITLNDGTTITFSFGLR